MYKLGLAAIAAVIGLALPAAAGAAPNRGDDQVIASGLDNPRGLAVLADDRLAVAEAGHAGGFCLGPGECLGLSSQVTVVDEHGRKTVVVSALPSLGGPFGPFGLGGVTTQRGKLYAIVGLNPQAFGEPAQDCQGAPDYNACVAFATSVQNGVGILNQVRSWHRDRGVSPLAGVGEFDFNYAAAHPDPGNPEYAPGDANPFGLSAGLAGGFYVVDAASNTLDFVSANREISVLAFIPDPPDHTPIYDAAPTCAARTPNGDVYIGTESNTVWRWHGQRLTKVVSGGNVGQVVGCVADKRGNVYLDNLSSKIGGSFPNFNEKPLDGSIVKLTPNGRTSYVAQGLNYPTGLTLGEDGELYIAVNGLCPSDLSLLNDQNSEPGGCPASGQVLRLRQ